MQRTIRYRLFLWFDSLFQDSAQILSLGETDLNFVLEIEPGKVLRLD